MSAAYLISKPVSIVQGDVTVPGDKSISQAAIVLGAIATGTTTVNGVWEGKDCIAIIRAFQSMGVRIEGPVATHLIIHGVGKHGLKAPSQAIECCYSAASMKLLAGLLAAQPFDSELIGDAYVGGQSMECISRPLHQMNADVLTSDGRPPLFIRGGQCLQGIHYKMPEANSHVKSCLLLAGLYAEGETSIIEPAVTADHTERMLAAFSYPLHKADNMVTINSQAMCISTNVMVPGDLSSAIFLIVVAAVVPGSTLYIRNVGINPTRTGIIHLLRTMGANIQLINKRLCNEELVADLYVEYTPLEGIEIPSIVANKAMDTLPFLLIAASCAKGQTLVHLAKDIRIKDSHRIRTMAEGLQCLGSDVQVLDDGIFIQGGPLGGGVVDSNRDPTITMAFVIAGAVAEAPVKIKQDMSLNTFFPGFIDLAHRIHLSIQDCYDE